MSFLELFSKLEEEADCLVLLVYSQSHVVAILLNHFDFTKCLAQFFHKAEQGLLCEVFESKFRPSVHVVFLFLRKDVVNHCWSDLCVV